MKEANTLVEYGSTIDPSAMVEPPDVTELILDPGHPGEHDAGYVARGRSCSHCAARTGWSGSARRS